VLAQADLTSFLIQTFDLCDLVSHERVAKLHRGYRVPSSLPDFLSMVAAFGFFQP
jgi:hypothetical protein